MKYIVLGSNGFIGRRLTEILQEQKQEVKLIPRDWYGNYYALKEYLEAEQPHYIINCAAYGNHSSQSDLHAMYEANVMNSVTLLEASKNIPYKGLIIMGSSSEYGVKDHPMAETDYLESTSFYGVSKIAQTYLAHAYNVNYQKPIVVVRPFSVYGPGEAEFRFIPTIIKSAITGEVFNLAPNPTHDWIFIDDFVEGMLAALHIDAPDIYNVGTGQCISNQALVDLVSAIAVKKLGTSKLKYTLLDQGIRKHDSPFWQADTTFIRQKTGWSPQYNLVEGLKKTFDYYRDFYDQKC